MSRILLQLQRIEADGPKLYEPDEHLRILFEETKEQLLPRMDNIIDDRGLPDGTDSEYDADLRSWMKRVLRSKEHYARATFMGLGMEAVGGEWSEFIDVLAGEEFLYAAQMILDDIVDGQTERHGRETISAALGTEKSIAVAEMFGALGYKCMQSGMETGDAATQEAVLDGAFDMMQQIFYAQYLDEALEEKPLEEATRDDYWHFLHYTTPADIAHCFEVGARLGQGTDEQIEGLREYGRCLGRIMQIRDDYIDYISSKDADKRTYTDMMNSKKRLPLVLAYEYEDERKRRILSNICRSDSIKRSVVKDVKIMSRKVAKEGKKITTYLHNKCKCMVDNIELENGYYNTLESLSCAMII